MELMDLSIVITFDVVLELPQEATTQDVAQTILSAVSAAYNISAEYFLVDVEVLQVMSRRRLMQAMSTVKYRISIRVLFARDALPGSVNQTQTTLQTLDNEQLTTVIRRTSPGVQFNVFNSTFTGARDDHGVFNVNSREVVTCALMPWHDERGAAQACVRTCRVDEDIVAVAYVQGLYVLDCKSKTGTPVVPPKDGGTPGVPPTDDSANQGLPVLVIGVGTGLGLVTLAVGTCILSRRK
jgi:hypothetical protein